ncbi:MAG: hypothetical protein KBS35_02370 [Mycoplasma sp.]|nr:hypothetical protein [Candidatus Hennigella equi]
MENKNKVKPKLTVKNINKTFGVIIFVLVFLFTFLFTSELKQHWVILLSVFGGAIALAGIVWLVMALVVRHLTIKNDENKQKINKALKKLKEDAIEESKKLLEDESNS